MTIAHIANSRLPHMKIVISAAALLLLFGTTASVHAQQDRPQDNHQQENKHPENKPEQKGSKPTQQHQPAQNHTERAAPQQHPTNQTTHTMRSQKPEQRRTNQTQHSTRSQRPQRQPANRTEHANAPRSSSHTYGRISDTRYRASFGSQHRFHVSRSDYQHRSFQYGGYSFRFVDPWPPAWAYSDPVYIVYEGGGYYMYDPVHPGLRITLTIF